MSDAGRSEATRAVRRTLNEAVANGKIDGNEAIAILMFLATTMVAAVDDAEKRDRCIKAAVEYFPEAVEIARRDRHMLKVERADVTLQ